MTTITVNEEFSNIVTPPDFVSNGNHNVVLIDPAVDEIEDVALYLKTSAKSFNVYVYSTASENETWLTKAIEKSADIIINTVQNEHSPFKDVMAVKRDVYHYGNKRFLKSMDRHISKPIDYFVKLDQQK